MSGRVLIRPEVDTALHYYDARRKTELIAERRQLRADELEPPLPTNRIDRP
jgi:hypothetical protein